MNLSTILHSLTTTATCIGFVVMCAWIVLIVWMLSVVFGEIRFNRLLRRTQRASVVRTSSTYHESHEIRRHARSKLEDGFEPAFTTAELPINFQLYREDDLDTEETGAVFNIRERYPDEFA